MGAFKVLELCREAAEEIKNLESSEIEIIEEYIGDWISFDEAHNKLEELKCKQGR